MKTHFNTKVLLRILITIVLSIGAYHLKASDVAGSELSYRCLNKNGDYEITLILYRDCQGVSSCSNTCGAACTQSISITGIGTSCGILPTSATLSLVNVRDVSPFNLAPTVKSICRNMNCVTPGTFTPGIERYTFVGIVNLGAASSIPASCCEVRLSYSLCCRSNAISTGGASSNYYTEATINRCLSTPAQNSSPRLLNDPVLFINSGQHFVYNAGAVDPDLDSLSYSFVPALSGPNTPITYVSPYTAERPMPWVGAANANFPNGIGCNPQTGDIWFTPSAGGIFTGIPAVQIQEWRRDSTGTMRLLGTTRRDYFAQVRTAPPNNQPLLTPPGFSVSQPTYEVCSGNTLCFDINSFDSDTIDTTYLNWDGALSGFGATFTPNYNAQFRDSLGPRLDSYKFCWTPTHGMANELPYQFTVSVRDSRVPVAGSAMRSFRIKVLQYDSLRVKPVNDSLFLCIGSRDTLRAHVYANATQVSYQWYRNGNAVLGATLPYLVIDSFRLNQSGNYSLKVSSRCASDSAFVVTVLPKSTTRPTITIATTDTAICPGQSVSFTTAINDTFTVPINHINWHLKSLTDIFILADSDRVFTTTQLKATDSIFAVPVFANTANACLDTTGVRSNAIRLPSVAVTQTINVTADKGIICAGEPVTFTASNSIHPDSTFYQWHINGFAAGIHSSSFTINPDPTDTITVVVTSSKYCLQNPTEVSNGIHVPHYPATTILQTLANVNVCSGKPLNWPIFVSGVNLHYTWFKDGIFLKSDTSNRYIINQVQYSDSGNYQVTVIGQCDTLRGVSAQLTVPLQANIDVQPISTLNVCASSTVNISATVSGSINRYEWYRNGIALSGSNFSTLQIPTVNSTHAGNYHVKVFGVCDTLESDTTQLSLILSPVIVRHPQPIDACMGNAVTFQAAASGNVTSYYWSRNSTPINNSNDTNYHIVSAHPSQTGLFRMHAIGTCDTVATGPASLIVLPPPAIDSIYGPVINDTNTVQQYSVMSLAGNDYQWYVHNGIIVSGQHTNQVNVRWTSLDSCALAVVVNNFPGCADTTYLVVNTSIGTGINTVQKSSIKINPNPTTGLVYIETNDAIQHVNVYALDGKLVQHHTSLQDNSFTIEQPGLYLIEVALPNETIRYKIVVKQ